MATTETMLAATVRSARAATMMTQRDLALAADVSERSVMRIEGGQRVSPDTLASVCAALDINPAELFPPSNPVSDSTPLPPKATRRFRPLARPIGIAVGFLIGPPCAVYCLQMILLTFGVTPDRSAWWWVVSCLAIMALFVDFFRRLGAFVAEAVLASAAAAGMLGTPTCAP